LPRFGEEVKDKILTPLRRNWRRNEEIPFEEIGKLSAR